MKQKRIVYRYCCAITLVALFVLLSTRAAAGSNTPLLVTRRDDPEPNGCTINDCSLREAIIAANATDGADTITLPGGTYALTRAGSAEDAASTGDLDIIHDLTITTDGVSDVIIDAGNIDRVIHIWDPMVSGVTVVITGVVVQHGMVADSGGGIFVGTGGTLRMDTSIVQSNTSTAGNGGGGLFVQGGAALILTKSSVVNNVATGHNGGGIRNNHLLSVTNSTISGNRTVGQGGGIHNNAGTAILANVTVANNEGNTAGIVNTIGSNFIIKNTLLADNHTTDQQPWDCSGLITSQGYNLIQTSNQFCTLDGSSTGNIINQSAKLGELQNNGGSTPTHALPRSSPAFHAGNPDGCRDTVGAPIATDQRGFPRPNGTGCDIGAYEVQVLYVPLIQR